VAAACAAALAAGVLPTAASAKAPVVEQLVSLRSGKLVEKRVRAKATRVKVERRRCAVAEGTALASLVRARPGRIALADYGECGKRARNAGGLYVRSIAGRRARGLSGWVYKVGNRLATAGAADPAGAFGRGRLRRGQRVTWFYCRLRDASCPRTLGVRARPVDGGGGVDVLVRGYDDHGRPVPVPGAVVRAGGLEVTTGAAGRATLVLGPGSYRVAAVKRGLVPSFRERVIVP
jgi:hypothetical protein